MNDLKFPIEIDCETRKITDVYFELQQKYEQIYGKKTVVIMEVGDFMEIYGVENKETGTFIGDITTLCKLMDNLRGVKTTNKNFPPNTIQNPYISGFNTVNASKYYQIRIHIYY